jgi:hypothetical protein
MTNANAGGTTPIAVVAPLIVSLPYGDSASWSLPLDNAELQRQVASCRDAAPNTTVKGARLENLMCWLFPHLPGVTAHRKNVYSEDGSQEVDVVFSYDSAQRGIPGFGFYFIGECKNWARPVDSGTVAWMDWKIQLGGVSEGILLATEGVTQRGGRRSDASAIIAKANASTPQRRILIVTLDEVSALSSTADLKQLLIDRMLDLVTGTGLP